MTTTSPRTRPEAPLLSTGMTLFFACACALTLANIYYAQPILADIAADLGLAPEASGVVVTLLQAGYMLGILFMGPLGDLLENRRLIAGMVLGASVALWSASASGQTGGPGGQALFFAAHLGVGFCSAVTQIQVAFAAGLAGDDRRGRVLGVVVAGLFLGMILSRPLAGLLNDAFGWRIVYRLAALLMLVLGLALWRFLPRRAPEAAPAGGYPTVLRSMTRLPRALPGLPRLLVLSTLTFTGFCLFWTAAPLALRETLGFSPGRLALFTLIALVTPPCVFLAGRLLDRGLGPRLIACGTGLAATAFLLCACLPAGLFVLALAALLLDPGVNVTTLSAQQRILSMRPEARTRLNSVSVACNFCGGALGSALAPWLFARFGWRSAALAGFLLLILAFALNVRPRAGEPTKQPQGVR